jgi:hypothetical protein
VARLLALLDFDRDEHAYAAASLRYVKMKLHDVEDRAPRRAGLRGPPPKITSAASVGDVRSSERSCSRVVASADVALLHTPAQDDR